ncbi:MAG: response regulator [Anaerolineales bacterium]
MENQQKYVLVVDDIPDILNLLDATLKFKGFQVVTARNGQEALDAILKERPALVIADILMPKMDGFSLLHRIRLDPETRDIPVIFLSATYVAAEDKDFARALGVTRFIEKPVNWDMLLPIISEILTKGVPVSPTSLNEIEFYNRYRERLETKLKQKETQIARDDHLLRTLSEAEKPTFVSTLQQDVKERDEVQLLLEKVNERLNKLTNSK